MNFKTIGGREIPQIRVNLHDNVVTGTIDDEWMP